MQKHLYLLAMINPFQEILDKLAGLESKVDATHPVRETLQKEIIGRKELCKRLSITEPTAIRWEKKKKIPCFRIGSSVRYNWQTVIEKLEKKGGSE